MKTWKNLFPQICSFENLFLAAYKAAKGKRFMPNVAKFQVNLEKEIVRLQKELENKTYRPGKYRHFTLYDAKKRHISAAPFRDRVVHHALCNIIEPLFEATFIFDSYACRKNKGVHRAVERFSRFARLNHFVLKCDICKYFPNIDHQILKSMFSRKIRDDHVLWLLDVIIDSAEVDQNKPILYFPGDDLFTPLQRRTGLPIGNQTSQFFANVYLNDFDHFVKEKLHCNYYIRYVDDFVVFHQDKTELAMIRDQVKKYLCDLRLNLHQNKSQIFPVEQGTDFLGYRIFPTHRLVRKSNIKRFRRKMRRFAAAYAEGSATFAEINASVQSWLGHVGWANSYNIRKQLFKNIAFVKGQVNWSSSDSRRLVEQ